MLKIKIKYHTDITKIEKVAVGDWIDLRCARDLTIVAGQYYQIPLGISMELPEKFEAHIIPRSSTFKKHNILMVNPHGLVDGSFKGDSDEWHFLVWAVETTEIKKDVRLCQFRLVETMPEVEFEEVDVLGNDARGGMGSSGTV